MDYKDKIKHIFKHSYTEINKNHDEAVIAFQNYCNINENLIPIMVNYDSHSDLYLNMKLTDLNIANWVNFCFAKCGVTEYYWIIPNYIIKNPNFKVFFKDKSNKEVFRDGPMRAFNEINGIAKENFILNKKTNELMSEKKLEIINNKNKRFGLPLITADSKNLVPVSVYIVPFDKISILSGKKIALSVDADAFCNSGHDTIGAINNCYITNEELQQEFEIFINALFENNITVETASLTRSPAYFPNKFDKQLKEFFEEIKTESLYKKFEIKNDTLECV